MSISNQNRPRIVTPLYLSSDERYADWLKTVYLLGKRWSVTQVAKVLIMDCETMRNYFKRYRKVGLASATEVRGWWDSDDLTKLKIKLVFLPPYAPNLNLTECYWKLFIKVILEERNNNEK